VQDFRRLSVWNASHGFALEVYRRTAAFPKDGLYGLTSQTRRAAVSIAANIAEGCGRSSDVDFARLLQVAMGSACELEYHFLLGRDLGFLDDSAHLDLTQTVTQIKPQLASLLRKLRADGR
jgi:four helix bundle protein